MNSLKLFTAVLLVTTGLLFQEVLSNSIRADFDNSTYVVSDHAAFFKTLNNEEQVAIMQLAVHFFDADDIQIRPFPVLPVSKPKGAPFDADVVIPQTLVSQFLNGKVPTNFQKDFTDWLRKEYRFTDKNFRLYRETGSFCSKPDDCPLMDDIGGLCCPFG